ncbi:hypothetical protein BUALT_Bualt12G0138900 [Buddleja alternifolia]|uniref:acylaminoacyl-peptidase n=1 Tax=Buddleja alternifolia TaxID=168488 RepID=A0AAV6WY03_9LAMI|nr:hypothetical protein BUALT_Bualt12G0138900 [Buddleja alternifolia]
MRVLHLTTATLTTHLFSNSFLPTFPKRRPFFSPKIFSISSSRRLSVSSAMDDVGASATKEMQVDLDASTHEEYASISKLLQEFTDIPTIDKAWTFKSETEDGSRAMFLISQPNLLANKRRKSLLSSHISHESNNSINFKWAPFPVEVTGVSAMVPSPSGLKFLVIRNSEGDSPTQLEIWGPSGVMREFSVPRSIHGLIYADGWFEGISWNSDETVIAYVAEEPDLPKPTFTNAGYKKEGTTDKDCGSWKGQVERYASSKRWEDARKLGIKYCYNRPCALYAVKAPSFKSEASKTSNAAEDLLIINLTRGISSAFFPRFSPDGKFLVFLSAKNAVDSGAHSATDSLHKINWPSDGKLSPSLKIEDVVPVISCPEDGCFPGLYSFEFLSEPWLSDGRTMVLSSIWGSTNSIISVDVLSGKVSRISPDGSNSSWNVLTLDGDNVIADYIKLLSSSYDSMQAMSLLASLQFSIMKIPVRGVSGNPTKGASKPFEAIYVSSKSNKPGVHAPLIVLLHGGPHSVLLSSFSKSSAFLCSLGYNLLIVNYRGSLGFGEEALQSLPGNVGTQDVNDVLTAVDYVVDKGLADPSKIVVLGGSHGGFLTTHLIGQAPDKFAAAAARNPVCNLALMVGTSDIPDWCFFEVYGSDGKSSFTESPSAEQLDLFYSKSPISHISKVKTPTLFLLGAKDLRVPVSNGIQYARALKEKGVETKVIVFPNDVHGIDRPQSDFESFLNIGVWFRKYCR